MSCIKALYIQSYRNIQEQLVKPSEKINLFIAKNAQGKTNLLEAIYFLAHNKSFKTNNLNKVTPFNQDYISLSVNLENDQIKIFRSKNKNDTLINNIKINNVSKTSKLLPIQIISIDKGFITFSNPKDKRKHLDWGVFHVEQNFLNLYQTHKKTIHQINHLLVENKNKPKVNTEYLDSWFLKLAKITIKINNIRKKYIEELNIILKSNTSKTLKNFSFFLDSGLPKEVDNLTETELFDYLKQQQTKLIKKGFLPFGCHRANINFKYNKKPIDLYSRGQQKTFSIIFSLLQVFHLKQNKIEPVLLIDDISSELDKQKVRLLMSFLRKLDIQVFLTSITPIDNLSKNDFVFGINQGVVSRETK